MINKRICSEIIPHYVEIKDNSQRISFVENLRLSNKKIEWVTVCNPYKGEGLQHYPQTADGRSILEDPIELRNTFLVLVNKSREIINRVSLMDLLVREQSGNPISLKGREADISSSYIMRSDPQNTSVGKSIILLFGISSSKTDTELCNIQKEAFLDYIGIKVDETQNGYRDLYFPDQQSFRNRKLVSMSFVNCDVTPDLYASAFAFQSENYGSLPLVTLVDTKGKLVTDHLPITSLTEFSQLGNQVFYNNFCFDGVEIDWARSFISTDSVAGNSEFFFNLMLTKNW